MSQQNKTIKLKQTKTIRRQTFYHIIKIISYLGAQEMAKGPNFGSWHLHKSQVQQCAFITTVLQEQRRANPGSSVASQPSRLRSSTFTKSPTMYFGNTHHSHKPSHHSCGGALSGKWLTWSSCCFFSTGAQGTWSVSLVASGHKVVAWPVWLWELALRLELT